MGQSASNTVFGFEPDQGYPTTLMLAGPYFVGSRFLLLLLWLLFPVVCIDVSRRIRRAFARTFVSSHSWMVVTDHEDIRQLNDIDMPARIGNSILQPAE